MSIENDSLRSAALLRLRVTAEPDSGALIRVLERFQILNLIPRRVIAECGTRQLHIHIDIFGIPEERLTFITAKLGQVPCVIEAHWFRV
jgi:hypothetical protein